LSVEEKLEKVHAMREELEEESRLLIVEQQTLEKNVRALEEQVVLNELKRQKALVEDLRSRNKAIKSTIAQLEAKKKELETKLGKLVQTPKAGKTPAQPGQTAEASESPEAITEENGVTITVMESEEIVETEEEQQEKKKRRFF
jgi:hypothetical protein